MTILFNGERGPHGYLSNFAPYPIELDGKTWPTTEHYFQAKKFEGTFLEERIREADTPREAKELGRTRKLPIRRDWEKVKERVMREALVAKFTQHPELAEQLQSTAGEELVEHSRHDRYWADGGGGGRGKNRLGKLLMSVRRELGRR